MLWHAVHPRRSITVSPLLVFSIILAAILAVEGLLLARFWLQLAAADPSAGLNALVFDASRPLVAPFTDTPVTSREVGWLDRHTLIAALSYFGGGLALLALTAMVVTLLAGRRLIAGHRDVALELNRPPADASRPRLVGVASVNLTPSQATRVVRLLRLQRLNTDLYIIPAAGGCTVAAFAEPLARRSPLLGHLRAAREALVLKRSFRAIESRFRTDGGSDGRLRAR